MLLQKRLSQRSSVNRQHEDVDVSLAVSHLSQPVAAPAAAAPIDHSDILVQESVDGLPSAAVSRINKAVSLNVNNHEGDSGPEAEDEDEKSPDHLLMASKSLASSWGRFKRNSEAPHHKQRNFHNMLSLSNLDLAFKEQAQQDVQQSSDRDIPGGGLQELPRRLDDLAASVVPKPPQPAEEAHKPWKLRVQSLEQVPPSLLCPLCLNIFTVEREPYRPFYSLIKQANNIDMALCRQCIMDIYNKQKYQDYIRLTLSNNLQAGGGGAGGKDKALNFKNNLARNFRKFLFLYFETDLQRLANALKFIQYNPPIQEVKDDRGGLLPFSETPGNFPTRGGTVTLGHQYLPTIREELTHLSHICCLCNSVYDENERLPFRLECGHNLCKNCILTSPYVISKPQEDKEKDKDEGKGNGGVEITCPKDQQVWVYELEEGQLVTDHLMVDKEMLQVVLSFDQQRKSSSEPLKKACDHCRRVFCDINRPHRVFGNCHTICYYCLYKHAENFIENGTIKVRCPKEKCGNSKQFLFSMPQHYGNFANFLHSVPNDIWQDDKLFERLKTHFSQDLAAARKQMEELDYPKPTIGEREVAVLNTACPGCQEEFDQSRLPYHLECPHSLCAQCIVRQIQQNNIGRSFFRLDCPLCHMELIRQSLYPAEELQEHIQGNPEFLMDSMGFKANNRHLLRIQRYRSKVGKLGDLKRDLECCFCYEIVSEKNLPRKPHSDCGYMLCTNCVKQYYPQGVEINCFCAGVNNAEGLKDVIESEMEDEEKVKIILSQVELHEEKCELLKNYDLSLKEAMAWN